MQYNPESYMLDVKNITSIETALDSNSHSLGKIQREHSKKFAQALIIKWLVYLNDMLNLNRPMSEAQLMLASKYIADEYYMLNIDDFTLLWNRILSGSYGEFYERLSIDKVMSFFNRYREERFEIAIDQSQKTHINYKQNENN
tara:strand:- start:12 stop:440 length:429 start_codon:yes stop_codon:yes gene_type:complete